MSVLFGTATIGGSLGVKTITVGFQPLMWDIVVEPSAGSTFTTIERSSGVGDSTGIENCTQEYTDPTRSRFERFNKTITLKKWNSGTSVYDTKVEANFDSTTATQLKLNFTAIDTTYQLRFKIWG